MGDLGRSAGIPRDWGSVASALEAGSGGSKALTRAGEELLAGRDVDAALAAFERALELAPDNIDAHARLATLLHRLGRDAEAIAHLRAAARLSEEPKKWIRRVERISGWSLDARMRQELREATELLSAGEPAAAAVRFERLITDRPRCLPAWIGLWGALQATGEEEAAARSIERCLDGWPRRRAGVQAAASRRLSARGLVFDPRDRFPIRPMDEVLTRVDSPSELRRTANAYWVMHAGGQGRERRPVISLAKGGSDAISVYYRTAPSFVAAVDNALLVGRGAVVTEGGEVVSELLGPQKPEKYGARRTGDALEFAKETYLDGACQVQVFDTPAFLMTGPADMSFGDWINQYPTRLTLAEAAKVQCPLVVRKDLPGRYVEMLAALGVDTDRLLFHDVGGVSIFPRLYAPSWPLAGRHKPMKAWFQIYQRAAASPPAERPRIYLSRRNISSRALVNEDEIISVFVSRGFQVVCPELLSFRETLDLFAGPSIVAGPYGSNLRNLVFCRQKPFGFILMPPYSSKFIEGSALFLAEADVRFGYVKGRSAPEVAGGHPNLASWTVSPEEVASKLDAFLAAVEANPA